MDIKMEILKIVKEVCEHLTIVENDLDKTFREVGIDSLDLSSILLDIEEQMGIAVLISASY